MVYNVLHILSNGLNFYTLAVVVLVAISIVLSDSIDC